MDTEPSSIISFSKGCGPLIWICPHSLAFCCFLTSRPAILNESISSNSLSLFVPVLMSSLPTPPNLSHNPTFSLTALTFCLNSASHALPPRTSMTSAALCMFSSVTSPLGSQSTPLHFYPSTDHNPLSFCNHLLALCIN